MKKLISLILVLLTITVIPASAQKTGLLNKVSKSANDILGNSGKPADQKQQPEPPCASDQAVKVMDLGGNMAIDYSEVAISILSDGRILARHIGMDEYYVTKDGVTTGPFKAGDPQIADFVPKEDNRNDEASFLAKHKPYITKSGEKYLITFAGKKYGPYAKIDYFAVSKSKDKFAAICTETIAVTEKQGEEMEKAMQNAKSQEEQMELAMQYAQQMQEAMMDGGGPESLQSKLVSNVPNVVYDPMQAPNGIPNSEIKYDDILIVSMDKIYDLQGKLLFTLKQAAAATKDLFVNSTGTKYAYFYSGTLAFSDNKTLTELFNPRLVQKEGKVYLAYLYYSPKNNAIMEHKLPF